jgi:hypothetical protein
LALLLISVRREKGATARREYRRAGVADCIAGPVDMMTLNQAMQQIVRINGPETTRMEKQTVTAAFADLRFRAHQDLVLGRGETGVQLTCQIACNRDPHFGPNLDPSEVRGFGLSR